MITVLGHLNPDTDTTCSAIAYAWYLNQRGVEATPFVTGPLNKETAYVLQRFDQTAPATLQLLTADHKLAIVDTNNPEELLAGWQDAHIVSIVDHHKLVGGLSSPEAISVLMKPVACTTTLILEIMDGAGITPSKEIAGLMVSAILSDTLLFTSPTTTDVDKAAAERLAKWAEVTMKELAEAMFAAKSDLSGMSPEAILTVDSKVFTLGHEKIRVSMLETTHPAAALALQPELEAAMAHAKTQEGITAALLFVVDILNSNATLLVPSAHEKDLASRAFGMPFTDHTLVLPGVVSRKKQVIPRFEALLGS
jgi:manganese-dependent inorganic pyrophosphatase